MQIVMSATVNDDQFLFTTEFFKEPVRMGGRDQGIIGAVEKNDGRFYQINFINIIKPVFEKKGRKEKREFFGGKLA